MRRFSRDGQSTETSFCGSHQQLVAGITADKKSSWSTQTGFLTASLAFSLSPHSLLLLPLAVIRHGGVAFLLLYSLLLLLLGLPLLLAEVFLGQHSSLSSTTQLYYNLCPLMSGLGPAVLATAVLRTVENVALLVWLGRALYDIFSELQPASPALENLSQLAHQPPSAEKMFALESSELISLAVIILTLLLLSLGGVRGLGQLARLSLTASLLLLLSLLVRAGLAEQGWAGLSSLLAPDWRALTRPHTWAAALSHLVLSTNLGTGVLSTFASNNNYSHNILRDVLLVAGAHLAWTVLATLLVSAILGLAGASAEQENVLDCLVTASTAMANLSQGWLWLGLVFILFIILTISNTLGFITLITSIVPTFRRAISTPISLSVIFFLSLILVNKTGPAIFLLVSSSLTSWPPVLFCLLTSVLLSWSHGLHYLDSDLTSMTGVLTPHLIVSHLTTSLYSLVPLALTACLYSLLQEMAETNILLLATIALPLLPLTLGALVVTIRALNNYPRTVVSQIIYDKVGQPDTVRDMSEICHTALF